MEPVKYEDLDTAIQRSLAKGHVLAEHFVFGPEPGSHLTTVQLSVAYDDAGRSKHYCNDVCADVCDVGSVQPVMVEWPQDGTPEVVTDDRPAGLVDVDISRLDLGKVREQDVPPLRILREAQQRLEELRKWTYARYRIAVHNEDHNLARLHAITLFFVSTGLKPGDEKDVFDGFVEHLFDSVVVDDAEDLPEFSAETGERTCDCG